MIERVLLCGLWPRSISDGVVTLQARGVVFAPPWVSP